MGLFSDSPNNILQYSITIIQSINTGMYNVLHMDERATSPA